MTHAAGIAFARQTPPAPATPTAAAVAAAQPVALVPTQAAMPETTPPARADFAIRTASFGGHAWVTKPNRDAVMGFTFPVEIANVSVRAGDKVTAGQLLVRARDGEAVSSLAVQRVRAENDAAVKTAKANLELAKLRFDAAQRANAGSAMNPQEFEERRLAVEASEAQSANALATQQEEQQKLVQLQEQVQRYRLEARYDGIVDMVAAEPGQAVDINQPVLRLVNIDPLWIDLPTPIDETLNLKLTEGSRAWVMTDAPADLGGAEVMIGRVLSVSPVTDNAGTRRVRVELPNPRLLPAGLPVRVRFQEPTPPATAKN
ncbi:MAG: HlyD family efflux transporter periplasmic adaptor subunit [Phycisphaerales bacterium]|nr:HlyD family efflux transporter periplasmic adaptor subunit [Phycisphaerales bacterium]